MRIVPLLGERPLKGGRGDEALLAEEHPQGAPGGAHLRLVDAIGSRAADPDLDAVLSRQRSGELRTGHVPLCDQHLTQQTPAAALFRERALELSGCQELVVDEHPAERPPREVGVVHASVIGLGGGLLNDRPLGKTCYERRSRTRSPTADISISAPVTSFSNSSAVGCWPSDHSSRSSDPASRRANQSLPYCSRRWSRSWHSNAQERRYEVT